MRDPDGGAHEQSRLPRLHHVPLPFLDLARLRVSGRRPVRLGTAFVLFATTIAAACSGTDEDGGGDEGSPSDTPGAPAAGPPADAPVPPESLPLPDAPEEACTAVLEGGLAIEGRTRTALRAELGEPHSVARETVPNRHIPGATDTVVTMRWPAATAVVRVAQSKELVDAIRVTDGPHLRYAGVGPGTPGDSILARLGDPGSRRAEGPGASPPGAPEPTGAGQGDPAEAEPRTLSYWCPSEPGAESPVVFHLRDGRVAMVEWDFYVD